jgi:hypothetical protein
MDTSKGDPPAGDETIHLVTIDWKRGKWSVLAAMTSREQRIAPAVIDPIVGGGGRHGQMTSSHVGAANGALPVIGAYVAVDI